MANPFQAYQNIQKYGFMNAIGSALNTPGGFLGPRKQYANPNAFRINAEYGLKPSQDQQQSIFQNAQKQQTANSLPLAVTGTPTTSAATAGGPAIPTFDRVLNGQTYTDINAYNAALLNQAQQNQTQAGADIARQRELEDQQNKFGTTFNGQEYTDPTNYFNALKTVARESYDKNTKEIEQLYQNGIISFDERADALKQNRENIRTQASDLARQYTNQLGDIKVARDDALTSQVAYFNRISPDAVQSQQTKLADRTNSEFNRGEEDLNITKERNQTAIDQALKSVDTNEAQLGREKGEFETKAASSRAAAQEGYQGRVDTLTNQERGFTNAADQQKAIRTFEDEQRGRTNDQSIRGLQDQLENQAIEFRNSVANAKSGRASAVAAKTQQFDTTQVLSSLSNYYLNAIGVGYTPAQARVATRQYLAETNIPKDQQDAIFGFLEGNTLNKPEFGFANQPK